MKRRRPQPLCARCGGLISTSAASITLTAIELPGRPRVAWHGGCAETDVACDDYIRHQRSKLEIIAEIAARGPARAVRDGVAPPPTGSVIL